MTLLLNELAAAGIPCDKAPAPSNLPPQWLSAATDQVVVRVRGADAARFLQGQVTSDVEHLDMSHSVLGAACTPKGRAYLTFRVARHGDDFLLRAPRETAIVALERLRKYMVFFKAEASVLEDWVVVGEAGEARAPLTAVGDTAVVGQGIRVRVPDTIEGLVRHELWLPLKALSDALPQQDANWLPPSAWQLSEIRAGIGEVTLATMESFVPQMLNWHLLDGISFKKGCYTGQEIIARMRYLGQLKRTLVRLSISSPDAPQVGATLMANDRKAGELVKVLRLDNGEYEALAVIQNDLDGPFQLETTTDSLLTVIPLPYEVPDRQNG